MQHPYAVIYRGIPVHPLQGVAIGVQKRLPIDGRYGIFHYLVGIDISW